MSVKVNSILKHYILISLCIIAENFSKNICELVVSYLASFVKQILDITELLTKYPLKSLTP